MEAGQQVTPTIRLVRLLGQGAMGSVWLAEHLALDTHVAVKFMASDYAENAGFVARFQREARAAAQLKSPHVVQILDHGVTVEGTPYIVMELLEGETVQGRMRRRVPMPLEEVVPIVVQTAKALGEAHRRGIVHRDIKPENLFLIDVEGELFVKVLDFGIAKQMRQEEPVMTSSGSLLGTPLYMSPEQLMSAKHVDHQTDLWSLAVVAYVAMTGRLPFMGEGVGALAVSVSTGVFPPPSSIRPEVPAAVDEWMTRALALEPAARFGSAKEMAAALEKAAGVPRPTVRVSMPSSQGQHSKRKAVLKTITAPGRREQQMPRSRTEPPQVAGAENAQAPVDSRDRRAPAAIAPGRPDHGFSPAAVVEEIEIGRGRIQVMRGDIYAVGTDAIIRFSEARRAGTAHITDAGDHLRPIRFVIQAASPWYTAALDAECAEQLRNAIDASLRLAEESSVRSVALAELTHKDRRFRYPRYKSASIAIDTVIDHLCRVGRSIDLVAFTFSNAAVTTFDLYVTTLKARARRGSRGLL